MAVLSGVGGVFFWFSFRHLDQEEEALNDIQEGHLDRSSRPEKELI